MLGVYFDEETKEITKVSQLHDLLRYYDIALRSLFWTYIIYDISKK